ncbi:hypothetical protein TIFTF001_028266 [Ficus carica]|uniref:Uncharacterized protein n=1 Tax=Ficus carica TaxID=3494 RepID=A0AA88DPL1_FICCA|nr:hypothetical protein TIFTF001_028266 [Ficus carica]
MKQVKDDHGLGGVKIGQAAPPPPPPPPPPPLPWFWARKAVPESVTKQEIAKFWRQKRIEEEDHLLAAIKAAARIRARNLSEEDYKYYEESLKDTENEAEEKKTAATSDRNKDANSNEIRVGIKDWWTKSKYAYLNQPAIESKSPPKRRTSTYIPNCISFERTPLYPTSLGVF